MEKIKVLLVEDEPTLAMIIKDTLDGNEFDITLACLKWKLWPEWVGYIIM